MTLLQEVCGQIVRQFKAGDHQLHQDTHLFDDLGLDSLDAVELIIEFEERYGIELLDSEIEQVKTIGDIVALIESKR